MNDISSTTISTNSGLTDIATLRLYKEVVSENSNCFNIAKRQMSHLDLINLLGRVLILAASTDNLKAVEFILKAPEATDITPNGQSGLGRAICFGSEVGNAEIVRAILQHPNAKFITQDGPFSLHLARAKAITAKAYSIPPLIESAPRHSTAVEL